MSAPYNPKEAERLLKLKLEEKRELLIDAQIWFLKCQLRIYEAPAGKLVHLNRRGLLF